MSGVGVGFGRVKIRVEVMARRRGLSRVRATVMDRAVVRVRARGRVMYDLGAVSGFRLGLGLGQRHQYRVGDTD